MKIGIRSSHAYSLGGGFNALFWHALGLTELGHEVTFFTTNRVHPAILSGWMNTVPIAAYYPGCEAGFDTFINIDHFSWAQPLAKDNIAHVFFPQINEPPPEGVRLYANSKYTAEHVKYKWNRDAQVMYIPIRASYHESAKKKQILHVSRFTEPTAWADKAHEQLIHAMKMYARHLPEWKLILAGWIDQEQEDYVNYLIQISKGFPIEFRFKLTDQQMAALFAESSFLWHATGVSMPMIASAQEHLGLTPLEASASGCIPIVFNSGGMPEVVVNGTTGVLFDDIRQMGATTVEISRDMRAWSVMSQQGVAFARAWQDFTAFKTRLTYMLADIDIPGLPEWGFKATKTRSDVTAVIPTFNNEAMLRECLQSLEETAKGIKVIIVNNGDDFKEPMPDWVSVLLPRQNLGFSGANKLAEGVVDTDYVLMLNDDVKAIAPGWLESMIRILEDKEAGIVGAKLMFDNGRLQHAGGMLDWNRPDIGFHRLYGEPDGLYASQIAECDFVTGACMLLRRELYKTPDELIGKLNYEELWMSMAAREKGFKTFYQPAAVLLHRQGVTKDRSPEADALVEQAKQAFRDKWYGEKHDPS